MRKLTQQSEALVAIKFQNTKKEKEEIEEQWRRKRYEEEKKLEEDKLKMKLKFLKGLKEGKITSVSSSKSTSAKLPELVESKCQGSHLDRQRFWGAFKSEIDRKDISQITKLSYLKKQQIPKIGTFIDSLSFSTELFENVLWGRGVGKKVRLLLSLLDLMQRK